MAGLVALREDRGGCYNGAAGVRPALCPGDECCRITFHAPLELAAFEIIERLPGNATTDFGGLGAVPTYDLQPLEAGEFDRQLAILDACWLALDAANAAASGKNLRLGPRGGGRQLAEMLRHLADTQQAYFSQLGWKVQEISFVSPAEKITWLRADIPLALSASSRGELPSIGPRGGKRWSAPTSCATARGIS